jgi:hypothetical protein
MILFLEQKLYTLRLKGDLCKISHIARKTKMNAKQYPNPNKRFYCSAGKEAEMDIRYRKMIALLLIALVSVVLLSGCNLVPAQTGGIPAVTPTADDTVKVTDARHARDAVLVYMRTNFGDIAPASGLMWVEENLTPEGLVGGSNLRYSADSWVVVITYPVVAPDATIYTVKMENETIGFTWEGLVDAFGQVVQTSVALNLPPTATPEVPQPTEPSEPEATEPPAPTPTPTLPPTNMPTPTPTPTPFPPTPTSEPLPCNAAKFVADVTVKDGSVFAPDDDFIKTWTLKNVGTCTWTLDYDLVYIDGNRMEGKKASAIEEKVKPGGSIDVSVALNAPEKPGDYKGYWMLRSSDGSVFGLGDDADKPFWVSITVVEPSGNFAYDFALSYCLADWRSDTGRLDCPGNTDSKDGFVTLLQTPNLENRHENEPALWVHPNEQRYGWIEGNYPTFTVRSGDHFKAWVGCLEGNNHCDVRFYLAYEDKNGKVVTLAEWYEIYDGKITEIDFDLSSLADQPVKFILGMEANTKNVDDAQGFWFVPRIERPQSSSGLDYVTPGS